MSSAAVAFKAEVGFLWKSPARVVCLLLVVAVGMVLGMSNSWQGSDKKLAGDLFQFAAMVAGLVACGWSAGLVLDDRSACRFETVVSSGRGAARYLGAKLSAVIAVLLLPGLALAFGSLVVCIVLRGSAELAPFLAGFAFVYLPIVVFASCFGACAGTLTRSRMVGIALFAMLWVAGVLYLPPEAKVVDVTGEALNSAFFQEGVSPDDAWLQDVPEDVAREVVDFDRASRAYSRYNPLFLGVGAIVSIAALLMWLLRRWRVDASALVAGVRAERFLAVPLPPCLLVLRAMKAGKLTALAFAVLLAGAAFMAANVASSVDARVESGVLCVSLAPLAFSLAYAGVYAADAKVGTCEAHRCLPHPGRPYAHRLVFVSVAALGTVALQAVGFQGVLGMDFASILMMGLAPTLFMGGIAYVLGVATGSESAAATIAAALWALLHLPPVAAVFSLPGLAWLYPFAVADAGWAARLPVLAVGLALFALGQALLGKTERPLVK
ncbi:hypothetical protein C1878_10835 [Gordonibacter sp. 28C]|uniref:hypothetical protein n=1 Tax=Gordonibacter sp. 28C TaxID=2078569 RepID=UPI000DF796C5|nr:hypothetical protein [Gordonibacter sp. 28C]RDB61517.1 hypothetical protein C1878_10835 [Gordonibacter sp. 28C]